MTLEIVTREVERGIGSAVDDEQKVFNICKIIGQMSDWDQNRSKQRVVKKQTRQSQKRI